MAKSRKVSSISKEFDGKEVQGKLIERSGLLGSKVKKEVFKFPNGGRHVEKIRTNKKGDVISRSSKDTKINPFKKGGMVAYEKSAYDKKADKLKTHGKEGSAKDMKADKAAAIKLGYMKKGGAVKRKK